MADHLDEAAPGGRDGAPAAIASIEGRLRAVRARARWLLVGAAVAGLLSAALAAALSVGVLDFLLRMPAWLRTVLWLAGVGALGIAAWRRVRPAVAFRPSLTDVALRLERSEEGRRAGLSGVLASGLELAREQGSGVTRWMADHVVSEAGRRFGAVRAAALIRPAQAGQSLATLAACGAGLLTIALVIGPRMTAIGASRVLAPWAGAQWPKRTGIADATTHDVHPLNAALPLRAAVHRTDKPAGETRVWAYYRVVGEGGSPRRVQLTGQNRRSAVTLTDGSAGEGELYERLIEPASLGIGDRSPLSPVELEYWFASQDDQTAPRRMKLVQPPSIVSAHVRITPPAYADISGHTFAAGPQDLGPGNDQRAIVGPVLVGSHITLTIRLNKPVPIPPHRQDDESMAAREAWLGAVFPGAELDDSLAIGFEGSDWTLGWTARRSLRLPVVPTDEYGLRSPEEAAFSIDAAADRPPTATVLDPRDDESVLATAVIDVTGEGRDDVGVSNVALTRQLARATRGSIGAAPEPAEPSVTISSRDLVSDPDPAGIAAQASISLKLELTPLGLSPGEELWLFAVASDNYEIDGERHEPVRSTPRKLRIISEEDLIDLLRGELGAVRKIAMRLDGDQAELERPVARGAVSADDRRRQAGLTQRITQQTETLQRLAERAERNRLEDEAIDGLLRDVESLLNDASVASGRAGAGMEEAAGASPDPERAELTPEQQARVSADQETVRDSLARLAEMLDKGEDSWLVSRTLQRLAQQERALKAQTERAGERNMGRRAEDLTPQERAEIAEIAERQRRLAEQARQAIDQLEQRSGQLKESDAAQSQAMKTAAERGRQQQVSQKMEEAAKNIEQNQTSQAASQQQEAADALAQMLDDLNEAQKNRDALLRRTLADILRSLDVLIQDQQRQVEALMLAAPAGAFAGLDAPMIVLNQNTLAVADKARSDRQMSRVADLVSRAASAQEAAIAALRAAPVAAEDAEQGEKESLRLLTLARDEAQKLRDEAGKRDTQKKRQELRQAYREALEEQAAIRGETEPYIGKAIDRRERIRVRGIGEKQETLRQKLADVKATSQELAEAGVFEFAHQRLESATGAAGKKLRAGQPDRIVSRNQDSAMRVLRSLIEALDDQLKRDDEFRDADGGGGGGGGGGQQQAALPPLAELRLLRAMQAEAAETTRLIDDAGDAGADELASVGELQRNLAKRGDELINALERPAPGALPEVPGEPAEPDQPGGNEG